MADLHFGGSFNPIHHGHLISARAVAEVCGYTRLRLIPAGQPPHKPSAQELVGAEDRLEMCRLATLNDPLFSILDLEARQPTTSYSINTVEALGGTTRNPIHWLIGADMLLYLPKWHRIEELLRTVHFVVVARPGWSIDWQTLPIEYQHLRDHVVESPLVEISASIIRRRIAAGLPIDYLTPPAVCHFINHRGLYRMA